MDFFYSRKDQDLWAKSVGRIVIVSEAFGRWVRVKLEDCESFGVLPEHLRKIYEA